MEENDLTMTFIPETDGVQTNEVPARTRRAHKSKAYLGYWTDSAFAKLGESSCDPKELNKAIVSVLEVFKDELEGKDLTILTVTSERTAKITETVHRAVRIG